MLLPWSDSRRDEWRFRLIVLITLTLSLLLGLLASSVELPKKERFKRTVLPPRLAQLILEQKQKPPLKPKVVKIPKKKPKPKPKKKLLAKKKPAPKPKVRKTPPKRVAKRPPPRDPDAARKKAAASGLLAFTDELADLRDDQEVTRLRQVRKLTNSGSKATKTQRSIITAGVSRGSVGIDTARLSRNTGGQRLSGRTTTKVSSRAAKRHLKQTRSSVRKGKNHKANRTREEIQLVFDQNKGAVYALYNRALRKDPSLRGKVVLQLTIAPSGKVTACKILSSELHDKRLEHKLVARVKLFRFPSKDVDIAIVSYPIDFLPS